jgi:hypothetical protein
MLPPASIPNRTIDSAEHRITVPCHPFWGALSVRSRAGLYTACQPCKQCTCVPVRCAGPGLRRTTDLICSSRDSCQGMRRRTKTSQYQAVASHLSHWSHHAATRHFLLSCWQLQLLHSHQAQMLSTRQPCQSGQEL